MRSSRAPPSLPLLVVAPVIILLSAFFTAISSSEGQPFSRRDFRNPVEIIQRHLRQPWSFWSRNMPSEGSPAVGPRLYRLTAWFDPEMAAVVTILLGLFQVLLSVLLASAGQTLPKLFIMPLSLGILIVAGGSLTMANERSPSRQLLQGCACSNVACLVGAVLAFCLYCYSLGSGKKEPCVYLSASPDYFYDRMHPFDCPHDALAAYGWSVKLMLLLYDSGAILLHSLLSVSALKALKTA